MIGLRITVAGRVGLTVVTTLILVFLALPIVLIVVTSFGRNALGTFPPQSWTMDWYRAIFAPGSKWPTALSLSTLVAAITTVLSVVLGVTAATALTRSDLPLRSAVYGLVLAPLLIPQVVTALGLFLVFNAASMLGSPFAIALGHTVLAAPIAVMILMATLRSIDERLEDAAASMGAGRLTVARRITFPLAAPGVIAAAIFAFITSFDEFFVAQFLSTVNATTLPVQIFNVLEFEADPTVTAVSVGLIGIAVLALALAGLARWLGSGRQSGMLPSEPTVTVGVQGGESA